MLFQKEKVSNIQIDRCRRQEKDEINYIHSLRKRSYIRKRSLKHLISLLSPMSRKMLSGKVSLCTSFPYLKKASLAVETALVLPLFFLGMVTMISFMDIYRLQTEHLTKLCQSAKEAGMYAYVLDGSGKDEIILPDVYTYDPVGGLIPLPKVRMHNTVKVHAWTGVEYVGDKESAEVEKMVYVTDSGSVYHKNLGCSYLSVSVTQVSGSAVSSMRNDYGEKYTACEVCSRNQKPAGSVYITKKSNRYHNLESCSGLKRSVRMVKESQAGELRACSRCG